MFYESQQIKGENAKKRIVENIGKCPLACKATSPGNLSLYNLPVFKNFAYHRIRGYKFIFTKRMWLDAAVDLPANPHQFQLHIH